MSVRVVVRWIVDRLLVAFAAAFLVVNGSSFGIELMNKGLLYAFEVFLVTVVVVGSIVYLIIPRGKPKKVSKN